MFAVRNLHVLAYAGGTTQWLYRYIGLLSDVTAPGFFNPFADMFSPGDFIMVNATDGGAMLWVEFANEAKGVAVRVMSATVPTPAEPARVDGEDGQ